MRRMITAKQAKGLEKLNNNIVINEDGTLVEVGGNIAVESIEQVGYMVDEERIIQFECDNANEQPPIFPDTLIARNVSKVVNMSSYGETITFANPQTQYGDNVVFSYNGAVYWVINGTCYCNSSDGSHIKVDGELVDTGHTENYSNIVEGTVTVFKPFFTEEQYEAILDLIENA